MRLGERPTSAMPPSAGTVVSISDKSSSAGIVAVSSAISVTDAGAAADDEARAVGRPREGVHLTAALDLHDDCAADRVDDRRLLVADDEAPSGDHLTVFTSSPRSISTTTAPLIGSTTPVVAAAEDEARAVRRPREGGHLIVALDLHEDRAADRFDDLRVVALAAADDEARAVGRPRDGGHRFAALDLPEDRAADRVDDLRVVVIAAADDEVRAVGRGHRFAALHLLGRLVPSVLPPPGSATLFPHSSRQ